jgi:hypothetical protein
MPITRRRKANPPDQPENNHLADQLETSAGAEAIASEQSSVAASAETPTEPEGKTATAPVVPPSASVAPNSTVMPGNLPAPASHMPPVAPASGRMDTVAYQHSIPLPPVNSSPMSNGDRVEARQDYVPPIESGRRTARGELFRRPPQPPVSQSMISAMAASPLQTPSHEISLPLGNLLHLAYNPSYTGADEARSALLQQLVSESKAGGRGRCWNCGSLAIVYERWNTRSRNFGEVGVAFCEICGVWSVL